MYDINCYICYNFLTEPITLFCSHSFCKECIEKASNSETKCPECRDEYSLPLPPINKVLNKRMLKLKGIDFVDSDDENNKPINNDNNNVNNNDNNINNNNNNNQVPDIVTVDEPVVFNPNLKYIAADLLHLPRDVYVNIFTPFNIKEICNLSLVCKDLNKAANDNWLWKYKLIQFSQFSNPERFQYDYKKTYQHYVQCDKNVDKGAAGTFKMTAFRGHKEHITCLDHHGNFMSTGSLDHTVKVWDMNAKKGEAILSLEGHTAPIIAVKQLQTTVTSAAGDGSARIWDLENGSELYNFKTSSPETHSISYNPVNQNQLVIACPDEVGLYDLRSRMRLLKLRVNITDQNKVRKSQFNQRSNIMVHTTNGLESWDMRSPIAPLFTLKANSQFQTTNQYIFISIPGQGKIEKYSIVNGEYLGATPGLLSVGNVPFTATNETIAVGCGPSVQLYSTPTMAPVALLSNHIDQVNSILIDDKKILTASADNTIKVWDKKSNQRLYSLLGGSNVVRASDPPVIVKGCSQIRFDQSKVIGVFNNLVRVYNFRLD